MATPAATAAPVTSPTTLVVTQVRQALQQTAAVGACSPYLPTAWATRPVRTCFTPRWYRAGPSGPHPAEARAATPGGHVHVGTLCRRGAYLPHRPVLDCWAVLGSEERQGLRLQIDKAKRLRLGYLPASESATYHLNLAELILFNMAAAVLSGLNTEHEIVERYGTIPQDEQGSFDQAQRQRRRGLGIGLASTRGRVRLSEMFGRKEK